MASGLATNLHTHLVCRFLAGLFASTPLSCAGGTVADLWNPLEKTFAFPLYAIPAFAGPMVGQIIGSYIPSTLGWRWLEWIMLLMGSIVLVLVFICQPETCGDVLLCWKASIMRKETGDRRFRAPMELNQESLGKRLKLSVYRPFAMFYSELILILFSVYLTTVYIVLFTFLDGYSYIFGEVYNLSEGLTNLCWASMLTGVLLVSCIVPVVYSWTAKTKYQGKSSEITPESRLWYTMYGGALAVPISLFWMGWTSNVSQGQVIDLNILTLFFFSWKYRFGRRLLHPLSSALVLRQSLSFHICISLMRTALTRLPHWGFWYSRGTWLREL